MRKFFYVPENLDLASLLKASGYEHLAESNHLDRFNYLIDLIYLTTLLRGDNQDDFVALNAKLLEEILSTRWAGEFKKILLKLRILEEKPSQNGKQNYSPNFISKQYRLCAPYAKAKFRTAPITNSKLLGKLEAKRIERNERAVGEHSGRSLIKSCVENIEFDSSNARAFLARKSYETERQQLRRHAVVERFDTNSLNFNSDSSGRFHHIFTICPRDLRPFARFHGQPLFEIDVTDCQPALHAILYPPGSPEKVKYVEIMAGGRFKAFINSKLVKPFDLSDLEQKGKFKKDLFHHVLYGSPYVKPVPEIANVFATEFPELYSLISSRKKYSKRDLPILMQSLESQVVIDNISARLSQEHAGDKNFCLISIHDCLVTTEPYVDEVKAKLVGGFRDLLGFELVVKVKPLSPESHTDFLNGGPKAAMIKPNPEQVSLVE